MASATISDALHYMRRKLRLRLNPLLMPTNKASSEANAPPDRPLKFRKLSR